MNLAKLQKQLARDLKKSPKKAALLGVLALVALYSWAPLVVGYFKAEEKPNKASPRVVAEATPAAPALQSTEAHGTGPAAELSWREIDALIAIDERMIAAGELPSGCEPFGSVEIQTAAEEEDDEGLVRVEKPLDQLGLVCTGTIIGPRRRVATINGRPVAEGREVQAGELVFTVSRVEPKQVLLVRNGQEYSLPVGGKGVASD